MIEILLTIQVIFRNVMTNVNISFVYWILDMHDTRVVSHKSCY